MRTLVLVAALVATAAVVSSPAPSQAGSGDVAMIVGNPASPSAGDAAIRDRLLSLGFTVQLIDDNGVTAAAANGKAFVHIASSVKSFLVGSAFEDVAVPVWVAKPWSLDDMKMTGTVADTDFGSLVTDTTTIVDAAHPLATGLSGAVTISAPAQRMSFGVPGPAADIVSTAGGQPSTFVYATGSQLADGSAAAGCRLHGSAFKTAPLNFTGAGWALFDAMAEYAGDNCSGVVEPPDDGPYVIVISVDGLKGDVVADLGQAELPNLHRFINEGATTANARTMRDRTSTLPNHTSEITGLPVLGASGHQVTFNEDNGSTIHATAGRYVPSMFDVAHDAGLSTAMYAGKPKFNFLNRSWNATNGAPDVTGEDNGRDKIDVYERNGDATTITLYLAAMAGEPYDLSFVHFANPDGTGHAHGWESTEYLDAIRLADSRVGQILDLVDAHTELQGNTHVLLTSDHGGMGTSHADTELLINAQIPMFAWGPTATAGADLYTLNGTSRLNPGTSLPDHSATPQPIRNGDVGNLALDLLGLGNIPGSTINGLQDLEIGGTPPPDNPPTVGLTLPANGATVSGSIGVTASAVDDNGVVSVEFAVDGAPIGTDTDGSDGWSVTWDTTASPDGAASVSALATDTIGQTGNDTITVTVSNSSPAAVLMVVSNPAALTSGDTAVRDRLVAAGYAVNTVDDSAVTAGDAAGAAFVYISSSVNSGAVGSKFVSAPQPVWVAKPWLLDNMKMTGTAAGPDYGSHKSTTVTVAAAGHPLAAGLAGDVVLTSSSRRMSYGVPGGDGVTVTTANGLPSTFVYQAGDVLSEGSSATGCRLHASAFNTTVLAWNADAWALFDAAASYAAGGCG